MVLTFRGCAPNAGGPDSIPDQATRSRMQQQRFHMPQLRSTTLIKKKKKRFPLGDTENRLMVAKGEAGEGRNGNRGLAEANCYVQDG